MARSMSLLPMVLLALGAWMLSSLTQSGFVMNSATPRGSKVAMRGFKDDFYAWKETLSSEDQALLLKQAQNASWHKGVTMEGGFNETHVLCSCLFPWHVFFWPWQVGKYGYSMENGSSLRSSTRSSALRMSSRRASQKTRLNPSERSCRSSSTTSERTTKRMSP